MISINNKNINLLELPARMATKLLNVRIPQEHFAQIQRIAKEKGYLSCQEFAREAIRSALFTHHQKEAFAELDKLAGSMAGKPMRDEHEVREEVFREIEAKMGLARKETVIAVAKKYSGSMKGVPIPSRADLNNAAPEYAKKVLVTQSKK